MAAELAPVYIEFKGDAKQLQDTLKTIQGDLKKMGKSTEATGKDTEKMSAKTVAAGVVMADVFKKLASEVMKFGKEFVSAYTEVGGEVKRLQRIIGGSAEDVSRLRYAAEAVGVSADSIGRGMKILSGHLMANDDQAKNLGITYRNTNGQLLPTNQILENLSERFTNLPNGLYKTSLAVKAFGRSGTEMIPILNLGKKGLQDLYAEADKLGLTLTGKNLEDVKHYAMAQRKLHAAVKGLQIAVGKELVPALTKFIEKVVEKVLPVLQDFVNGLTGRNGLKGSLQGSASQAYKWGKTVVALIQTMYDMKGIIIVVAGLMVAMWAGQKIAAGVAVVTGAVTALIGVYEALTVASTEAAVAEAAATGGISVAAAAIGVTAALALIGGIAWKVKSKFSEHYKGPGLFGPAGPDEEYTPPDSGEPPPEDTGQTLSQQLAEEAAKVRASIRLKKLGASKGLIQAVLGSDDWKAEFAKLSAGGVSAVAQMQNLFNRTAAGIAERARAAADAAKASAKATAAAFAAEINKVKAAVAKVDAGFIAAKSKATTIEQMQSVATSYLTAADAAVKLARAEEVKTRGTKAHAAAVAALNKAMKEQAKIQSYANSVTKQANALAEAAAKAAAEAARQQAILSSTMSASNSWLAAQTRRAGPTMANAASYVNVPVIIDGQTVFRVTQKFSNLNGRRNTDNGLAPSTSLI